MATLGNVMISDNVNCLLNSNRFAPGAFWNFLDIILWIFLIFAGISAILNAIKNQKVPLISILFVIWVLIIFLWFLLICSNSEFIGKFMIWMFALWAFMRWIMLAAYALQKKSELPLRWGILLLWWLLLLLAIMIAVSNKAADNVRNFAGICIGISIIIDGVSLLLFALKWGNLQTTQAQIITQANENEIAQWDVVVTSETVVITNNTNPEQQNW